MSLDIKKNELHDYVDLLRGKEWSETGNALYNVIRTMRLSRHDKVCGEDFSQLDFGNIPFNGIHFSLNGEYPCDFTGCKLNEWNFKSGHSDSVTAVAWSPDGRYVLTGSEDNSIIAWDVESGLLYKRFMMNSSVSALAWSKNGKYILSGSNDGNVILWWVNEPKSKLLVNHNTKVETVAFTKDSHCCVSYSRDKAVPAFIFNIETEESEMIPVLENGMVDWIKEYENLLFNCRIAKLIKTKDRFELVITNYYTDASYSDNLEWYVTAKAEDYLLFPYNKDTYSMGYYAEIWRSTFDNIPIPLRGHKSMIQWVKISFDSKYCATGSIDSEIKIWHVENGDCIFSLENDSDDDFVTVFEFSTDSKMVIVGYSNGYVRCFDILTKRCVHILKGYFLKIDDLIFSDDGKWCMSKTYGGFQTYRIWSINTGSCSYSYVNNISKAEQKWIELSENRVHANEELEATILQKNQRYKLQYSDNYIELYNYNDILLKKFDIRECQCALSEDNIYCIVNYHNEYVKLWDIKAERFKVDFFSWREFFDDCTEVDKWKLIWGYPFYAIKDGHSAEIRFFDYFSESKGNPQLILKIYNLDGIYINNIDFRNVKADKFTRKIINQFIETEHD